MPLISAKARIAIANQIRKMERAEALIAIVPIAQACKNEDKAFSIVGFCEECGTSYSDALEVRSKILDPDEHQ